MNVAVVIGAIQCANAWMWTDVPSAPTHPDTAPDAAVIPVGVQPRLQLSLDLLMIENCKLTRRFTMLPYHTSERASCWRL